MSLLTANRRFVALLLLAIACTLLVGSCSHEKEPAGRKPPPASRDFAGEARRLKETLGGDFIVEVAKPFVIAGDIPRPQFDRIVNGTILNCSSALYKQFFTVRPEHVIKVFLFKDDPTYREYARKLFGDRPTTPFGYYKAEEHSLVMNIATGTGTLVHEMVHALIAPDFPQVPTWFNEGLASLFEQCAVTPHGLKGRLNWRLPILLRAIKEKKLTGLRNLVSTTSAQFYGDARGTNYAEARYFCMYMQELGLLEKFYATFRANFKEDPTGGKTIEGLFGKKIEEIQQDWTAWVERLPPYRVNR